MAKVTEEEIKQINRLYKIYGTYSAVAKEVGRAPNTVKKYVDPNFIDDEIDNEVQSEIDWSILEDAPPINLESWEIIND